MTTVYICGDSFGFSDPEHGACWADRLAKRTTVVNLCRVSASNFQIALQVQRAIEQGADYIIYLSTSSVRNDVPVGEGTGDLLSRYVDITRPDPAHSVTSYSVTSLNTTTPFSEEQLALLKLYHRSFFDLSIAVHQNELIIEGTLSKLQASKIPFTFDQGGFEHPKFANSKINYFATYEQYRSEICLWDYVSELLVHRPYYHITDHAIHEEIANYYHTLINDNT
jgi:hypothetical protein